VRIIRDQNTIFVHFESPLVIVNNTFLDLSLTSSETINNQTVKNEYLIKDKKVLNPPLTWFTNKADIYLDNE
jgi:hypothetical protein